MNVNYCSICSTSFDFDIEGDKGMIGLIPFAFCATCRAGVVAYVRNLDEPPEPHQHDWSDVDALGWKTCLDPDCKAGLPPSIKKLAIPFETFKEPICRGDSTLGTDCGHCEKCKWLAKHGRPVYG